MTRKTKSLYFIEETEKIEGAYVEIDTLYVMENQAQAYETYQELLSNTKKSTGLLLSEYTVEAEENFFQRLLQSFKELPAEFYRRMNILKYQALLEYQG